MMGEKGYSYRKILRHYFRNAVFEKLYYPATDNLINE